VVIVKKIKSISKIQILAVGLIVVGLGLVVHYYAGTRDAYRAMEFARVHNFDAGNPDPNLIRPWMNLQYIAVAYTVPQEFLFNELSLPMNRENSETPLDHLSREYNFVAMPGHFVIVDKLQAAILKYRENPVPTGLKEHGVRPWMNIQYVANSTGIPAEYIFEQIGLPMDGNAYLLLERLGEEAHYQGGPKALIDAVQHVVDTYEAKP